MDGMSFRQGDYSKCGLLNYIEHGDVVLADRGFSIQDDIAVLGARVENPSFTKGK